MTSIRVFCSSVNKKLISLIQERQSQLTGKRGLGAACVAEKEGQLIRATSHLGRGWQRRIDEGDRQFVVERGSCLPVTHVLVVDAVEVVVLVVLLLLFLPEQEKYCLNCYL